MAPTHMVKGRVYYDYKSMDGFRRLLVAFSSSSSSLPSSSLRSTHTIYCKKHEVRKDSTLTPNNKTIFSLGWPPYCNKEDIANLFSRVGHVVNVYLLSSPGTVDEYTCRSDSQGFKVSYIVFSTEDEAESALKLCLTPDPILCPINLVGVRKWAREYDLLHPSMEALEMDAEMGVALYDQQQKEAELVRSRLNKADEDGWITITRKTPRGMGEELSKRQRKRKKAVSMNVYPWQQRESQREQVAEMRRRFEMDKERVAILKERRKFKPF